MEFTTPSCRGQGLDVGRRPDRQDMHLDQSFRIKTGGDLAERGRPRMPSDS